METRINYTLVAKHVEKLGKDGKRILAKESNLSVATIEKIITNRYDSSMSIGNAVSLARALEVTIEELYSSAKETAA